MTLNELLVEWSYRTEKGYPDMGNPSDILVLKEILERLKLPTDILDELEDDEPKVKVTTNKPQEEPQQTTGGSESYDAVIRRHLGLSDDEAIPTSKNSYPWPGKGGDTFNFQVKGDDMKWWKSFWELTPPKEGQTTGGTKGVGNGEISLYWLYQYSNNNVDVKDTRGSDNPDLRFNGIGVEVKAYPKHNGKHDLGRFGQDVRELKLLGIIFGVRALVKAFQPKEEGKKRAPKNVNPLTWNGKNLLNAFQIMEDLKDVDLVDLAKKYDVFALIAKNIKFLNDALGEYSTPEEGAKKMAIEFVMPKLGRKPGPGGFLANVLDTGDCRFWQINFNKVLENDDALNKISASQGAMSLDFDGFFG